MKIIAGGRGSGKTYKLIHMTAKDPNGVYVCRSETEARAIRYQYRDVIAPSQILSFESWQKQETPLQHTYLDRLKSGDEVPNSKSWIKAVAVEAESTASNIHLSDDYVQRVLDMELEDRRYSKNAKS